MFFLQQMQQQNTQKVEASKVPEYIKKAAKKAAEFNSSLNRERMEERRAYFDLQTHVGWPSSAAPGLFGCYCRVVSTSWWLLAFIIMVLAEFLFSQKLRHHF